MLSSALFNIRQSRRVNEAQATASRSASKATDAQRDVNYLDDRVDRLTMICMALWELLKERTDLTEEALLVKVQDIDLRDGQLDGKIRSDIKKCTKCSRVMSPKHSRCLYCGTPDLEAGAFESVL